MHQRDIKKTIGPVATVFEWQGNRAKLIRSGNQHFLSDQENRIEVFTATPGYGAHGRAVKILNGWWDKLNPDEILTTTQAAGVLRVSAARVRTLLSQGRIVATKGPNGWRIRRRDLAPVMDRPPGRPRKSTAG